MSERAISFVEEWVAEHIHGEDPEVDASQAAALAQECTQDAEAAGIPRSEIEDVFDNLTEFMGGQIKEASDRETGRDQVDDEGALRQALDDLQADDEQGDDASEAPVDKKPS